MNYFDPDLNRGPMIGAHRGFRAIRPENTLSAFEASLGRCDYIELDVQVSRDGTPVIHHDDELGRTCNVDPKQAIRVDTLDLANLRQLDFGSWFIDADPFQTIRTNKVSQKELQSLPPQRIITLDELLQWRNRVGVAINIELKSQPPSSQSDQIIVEKVLQVVQDAGCQQQVLLSSFRHDYLKEIKAKMPTLLTGALQEGSHPDNLAQYLHELGVCAYHPASNITSKELIEMLRLQGLGVNVYTVNDPDVQSRMFQEGVTSIITDFPQLPLGVKKTGCYSILSAMES